MTRAAGAVLLVLGIVGAGFGFVLYYTCTASIMGVCFQYGYQEVGFLLMIFGGVMFVAGIILLAIPEKTPSQLAPYPQPQAVQYYPQQALYAAPTMPSYPAPPASQVTVQQSGQKFCPTCGKWYPTDYKLCPRDGTELKVTQS